MKNRQKCALLSLKSNSAFLIFLALLLITVFAGCTHGSALKGSEGTGTAITPVMSDPPEDVTLYGKFGLTVAIPNEIIDRLIVITEPNLKPYEDNYLLSVYEKRSYEKAREKYPDGYGGYIFSIVRYTQAQYERYLASDGSGRSFFARDDHYYYGWFVPTDVQFYTEGSPDMESDEWKGWLELNEKCRAVKDDFIARNHLTAYSDNEFWAKDFTYDSEHAYFTYYPYYAYQNTAAQQGFKWQDKAWTLTLSQPARQGEGGIWCVERMVDDNGNLYIEFPVTDGVSSADYFTDLQSKVDSGEEAFQRDPLKVALEWARTEFGHNNATEDSFKAVEGKPAKKQTN